MTDVDTIRWMASEHDLEFVDLDTYGVDPAAGEILSASLSRRHHVVAIKRKFGTPVIATADPDDLSAHDMVRAAIGREYISVVASRDQISDYLDRLFGAEGGDQQDVPVETVDAGRTENSRESPLGEAAAEDVGMPSGGTEAGAPDTGVPDTGASDAMAPLLGDTGDTGDTGGGADADPAHHDEPKSKRRTANAVDRAFESADWLDLAAEPPVPAPDDAQATGGSEGSRPPARPESDLFGVESSVAEPIEQEVPSIGQIGTGPAVGDDEDGVLDSANLLPDLGANPALTDMLASGSALGTNADDLAELAKSVHDEEVPPDGDSTALAADLVAEAVATFQEQQAEEDFGQVGLDVPTGTSMFPPLAKSLVDGERVSLEDMEAVLEEHDRTGQSIARILTAQKLVTEADLMWGMAQELGLKFVDLDTVGVDFAEAGTIPEATARHHNVMVIGSEDGVPVVAASNPTDVFAMDDLRTIMGRNFILVVATRTQISAYIGRVFNSGGDAADMAMEASLGFDGSAQAKGVDDIQAVTEEAPIVRYVNLLILQALNERASDIHVEPTATDLRIRYRIDGVLHDVSTAPRAITSAVTTRLKVMADMNVAEHRIPQDGRISLNVGSKGIDLRMATLPTIHGEKVVMRVLDKSSVVLGFADLGFDEDLLQSYERIYTKPYGTILVTGPTGSGKSTTLYTTLTALNSPEKNIITVEDPVELQLKGVNQVQLNVKAGLTFASALKSILRSDPDIVLVGEIRDKETAVISIEAALTGHMVLSTLHTNSAASTPMRLIEMGLEPFLVTSSLSGVLAQRLARRLCMHCKQAYEPSEADIVAAGWSVGEVEAMGGMPEVFRAVGCSACANTGYRGRKALAELLPMTEEIERMIIEGGAVEDIHKIAVAQGMVTLRQSGMRKAIEGETTLEEVLRVVA